MKQIMSIIKNPLVVEQFCKYVVVGGGAFVVDIFIVYYLNSVQSIEYPIAIAVGFSAGLVVNYILSKRWVFDTYKYTNKQVEFALFTIIGIGGLLLTEVFVYVLHGVLSIDIVFAKIATAASVLIYNFVLRKVFLF